MGLDRRVRHRLGAAATSFVGVAGGLAAAPAGAAVHHAVASPPALGRCTFSAPMVATPGYFLRGTSGSLTTSPPGSVTCTVGSGRASWRLQGTMNMSGTYGAGITSSLFHGGTCAADTGHGAVDLVLTGSGGVWNYPGTYQRLALANRSSVLLGSLGGQPYVGVDTLSAQDGNCVTTPLRHFTESGTLVVAPPGMPNLLP